MSFVQVLSDTLNDFGMLGVFFFMILENIGVPLPTEFAFLVAQRLIQTNVVSFWWAYTVINLGHLAGAAISYRIGLLGERAVARIARGNHEMAAVQKKLHNWYNRYGGRTVILGRLIGYVRPWSSYIAGLSGIKPSTFFLYTLIGSMIVNLLTMLFTVRLVSFWRDYSGYHYLVSLGVIATFLVFFLYPLFQRHRAR